jgi:uncharacterized repeat protein (TIGR01451 family)
MALNRTLVLSLVIGGIIAGATVPARAATSIPLPSAPNPPAPAPKSPNPPASKSATPPTLSIAVSSASGSYRSGAVNEYTVLVRNTGTTEATNVPVVLALPPSAKFAAAGEGGTSESSGVVWTADIKPMHQATLQAMVIGGKPAANVADVALAACVLKSRATKQICSFAVLPVVTTQAKKADPRRQKSRPHRQIRRRR